MDKRTEARLIALEFMLTLLLRDFEFVPHHPIEHFKGTPLHELLDPEIADLTVERINRLLSLGPHAQSE